MIKELIFSGLLCFGVSANSQVNNYRTLNGYYCFVNGNFPTTDVDLTFTHNDCTAYFDFDNNGYFDSPFIIEITGDSGDDFYVNLTTDFAGSRVYGNTEYNFYDLPSYLGEFCLYFATPYYLSAVEYNQFITYFTNEGNGLVNFYSGYFALNNSVNFSNVNNFSLIGVVSVNNRLYNSFYKDMVSAFYTNGDINISNHNCYFSGILIPQSVLIELNKIGVWAYLPDTSTSDFEDLFFSIADTPVIFLRDLMNFEIFGVSVFVGFCSLITVLLIVLVIKKVV